MSKRIFILEDDLERIKWFYGRLKDDEVVIVNNAAIAKSILHSVKFNMIFLDHDLGGEAFVDSEHPNTGWQVAKEIPHTPNRETNILIHSWNTVAAKRMKTFLKECDEYRGQVSRAQFGQFDLT